jgi:hypothetical protein
MKALGINLAIAASAYLIDQQYYGGYYWTALSSMARQIRHSFGWP